MGRYLCSFDWPLLFGSLENCDDFLCVFEKVIHTGLDLLMLVKNVRMNTVDVPCMMTRVKPLPVLVWNTIKSAGIARRTRGRRGGTATTKIHRIKPITPALRDSECFTNAADMTSEANRAYMQINLSGHNIIIARKPMKPPLPTSKSMRFSLDTLSEGSYRGP